MLEFLKRLFLRQMEKPPTANEAAPVALAGQERADENLLQSEERFRLLVESVRDYAIFMLDPEGRVATWNAGAERIKGYKAEEIIGRHFSCFYPPEFSERGCLDRKLAAAATHGRVEEEGWRV